VAPGATATGRWPVGTGTAEVLADEDTPGAWMLLVDDVPQSSVDPSDPTAIGFDYVRTLADVVDVMAPPGQPIRAVHLGAGALSLARYVAASRPRSRQLAIEVDPQLAALVRERFGVPEGTRLRVQDARAAVPGLRPNSHDLVVDDAFVAGIAPGGLGGVSALTGIARVLAPGGLFAVNLSRAGPGSNEVVRARLAAVLAVFPEVCLAGAPRVVKGRTAGNLVVVGSATPLPLEALAARLSRRARPVQLMTGPEIRDVVADTAALP
jgi:spermidine synthase